MRSCLIQLLVTAAVIFALLWFGLPFGAGWLATNALNAAGFTGTDTKVAVSAGLPPRILLGHADNIRLTSTRVSVGDLHASAVDITLADVELFDRTVGGVHGNLNGVHVPTPNGAFVTAQTVVVDGAGTNATATLTLSNSELEGLALAQLKSQKLPVTAVKLVAPDKVTITVSGQSKTGRLMTKGGAVQAVFTGFTPSTVTLIAAGSGNPFQFTSIAVGSSTVTLVGTIDLQALLGL